VLGADSEKGTAMQYEDTIEIRGVTSVRGSFLLLLGILAAPLVMTGYVGLTVLLFLPLLGLRRMFPRLSTPAFVRWDGNAPRHSGVRSARDAATRSA
jgi:hypothetical protein